MRSIENSVIFGYTKMVKMTITQLDTEKKELLNEVTALTEKKNSLYSNMDVESPMTQDEKDLNKEIAAIYSRVNQIVKQKNSLK